MKHLTQNLVIDRPYRRWPEARKREIVEETYAPGMSVSIVARRHDVNANQVFRWRQLYGPSVRSKDAPAEFVTLGIVGRSPAADMPPGGIMTIDLGNKMCVRVDREVDESALSRVLAAVRRLP